ncbi:MAG: DPP IV N-terminal domain-containing protein, partial [Planctomycetota bacterium]
MKPLSTKLTVLPILFLLFFSPSPSLFAANVEKESVRTANWSLAKQWLPDDLYKLIYSTQVAPEWLPESESFWYGYLTSEGGRYWRVDPEHATREPLFDTEALASHLTRLTQKPFDANRLGLQNLRFVKERSNFCFEVGEDSFEYDPKTDSLAKVEPEKKEDAKEPWRNLSPDNELCLFMRGNNLFLVDLTVEGAEEKQITFDGNKELSWGTDWELIENNDEEKRHIPAEWSKDSQHFALLRADLHGVGDLWLVDHLKNPRPVLKTYKCPFPGEKVPSWELWIFNRADGKMVRVQAERFKDQRLDDLFHNTLWWASESGMLFFARRSRDFQKVDVCAAIPQTGEVQTLLEERMKGQIYIQPPVEVPGVGALWWSMRDGWGHYYLYDLAGNMKNQVTKGAFNAEEILGVDEKQGVLYFTATGREPGRNPYYNHLYRVNLDGTGIKLLTPEDAEHQVKLSPTKNFFVDNYSRVNLPTRTLLRDMEGKLILDLETADISRLEAAGWQPPEIFKAKSGDGVTEQWGVMYKPFDFDPNRKYPIITRVYPGRQDEFIPKAFWPVHSETALAQLGSIVVRFGNRGGTFHRGFAYRSYMTENFRDYGLEDKKTVIEQLAAQHDFIDIDRVGIYGGSSGGFMTLSAMLVYPDFFKVGVSMTGPHDPSVYYNQWVERYQGIREVDAEDGTTDWKIDPPKNNIEL